ncbi:MAG: WecB/TagA/CpsF family glycosyltransferase [Synechococcales bacterium]|nr:WecB/TagA/CpsF family glycosyltransferase [Synechococcales bacterium]
MAFDQTQRSVSAKQEIPSGSHQPSPFPQRVNILGVAIDNLRIQDLLAQLKSGGIVFTPNVDHVIELNQNPQFREAYAIATHRTCDSQILMYASRFLGTPIREKISGSDLFPAFYHNYRHDEDIRIFLLGGKEGVARRAKDRINQKVGREMVVGAHSPSFGFENRPDECDAIIEKVNQSDATVLAVGVGAPKQEQWIHRYKDQFDQIRLFFALGATLDFEAGNRHRAPQWVSYLGLEWFYRLVQEPRRLYKRYLIKDTRFFWLLLQDRLNHYKR